MTHFQLQQQACLSYWFPRLQQAGLPVPRTEIVRTDCSLTEALDGAVPDGWERFITDLGIAVQRIGLPCFLRTGQTSGKHQWQETCYLQKYEDLARHVCALVEFSVCADFMGLPTDVWAVREMLPTVPHFRAFRGMPICREFRYFVTDGAVQCKHSYWPRAALEQGFPLKPGTDFDERFDRELPEDWERKYELLCYLHALDSSVLHDLASRAGVALGGSWSVDLLETKWGWFITDCAPDALSFHWKGCPNATKQVS